jgi:hypothetical protein
MCTENGCEHVYNDHGCDDGLDCTKDTCTCEGCVNMPIEDCVEPSEVYKKNAWSFW